MKPWPYPRLIAHRAGGALAPENTLAAIRFGNSLGYRAVEIDIRFTRDGVAVLQHDREIDRNTNGKGPIADHAWSELQSLDAGSWRNCAPGTRVGCHDLFSKPHTTYPRNAVRT